ncbi:hypothetical protein R5R35_010189 [Gryllus longicercus]|uniref:AP-5 complex subunit mu-1 n=1 Tax=Gryllus longicercus TaxID=2509291 RepID=A0AAN9VN02_9ORTH
MSIRAVYIIPSEDAEIPIFCKYFPSVEVRCKSRFGQFYVKIPSEREFVKLLFIETGIKNGDVFVEERDNCEKEFSNPAFQLKTDFGILWPVIKIQHKKLIYCAITFEENFKINQQSGSMKLAFMASVTTCLEALNGLSQHVDNCTTSQEKIDRVELLRYVNCAFPYGRPVCCNPSVALNFSSTSWKGKVKQPAWNPLQYRGKSQVIFSIKEEIRCIQCNQSKNANPIDICGTVTCTSDVEGVSPEISVVLTNLHENKCGLLVNACVTSVETISASSTRLRFHPIKSQNLCLYKMKTVFPPPIIATFCMKVKEDIADITFKLKLQSGVRNGFQKLEAHIPLNCLITAVKPKCSQGSLTVASKNKLIWNIGTKLPSKTLEATLHAKAKLKRVLEKSSEQTITDSYFVDKEKQIVNANALSETVKTEYATVIFKILDYVYSGFKIDPQFVIVSTSSKVNRSVSCECYSGVYKIWNENTENVIDDLLEEQFERVLECN